GFHTLDESASAIRSIIGKFQDMGVFKVAPSHCTGNEAVQSFKEAYGSDFIEPVVGKTFHV
ncbi:MAG: MBL fold metallo-hydrolase, partial [Syntrophorhabdus sp.]